VAALRFSVKPEKCSFWLYSFLGLQNSGFPEKSFLSAEKVEPGLLTEPTTIPKEAPVCQRIKPRCKRFL